MTRKQQRQWEPPSQAEFSKALAKVMGAVGIDGWQVNEVTQLCNHCPRALEELYTLLVRTTRAGTPLSCLAGWLLVSQRGERLTAGPLQLGLS